MSNIADSRYWIANPNGALILGAPRTVWLSASIDYRRPSIAVARLTAAEIPTPHLILRWRVGKAEAKSDPGMPLNPASGRAAPRDPG